MTELQDDVVGRVIVRRHHNARHIKFRLSPRRELIATAPPRTPLMLIKAAVRSSRSGILKLMQESEHHKAYKDQEQIGQSHKLRFIDSDMITQPEARRKNTVIVVTVPTGISIENELVQSIAQKAVIAALTREAKAYLPRRLKVLASRHGYSYTKVRYTHSTSRWGSCSSSGVISLNIALMKLPLDLIDYVLVHELCHTVQMNHSEKFWLLVEQADPLWRSHRRAVKSFSPLL